MGCGKTLSCCPKGVGFLSKIAWARPSSGRNASRSGCTLDGPVLLAAFRTRTAHVVAFGTIRVQHTRHLASPPLRPGLQYGRQKRRGGSRYSDVDDVHSCPPSHASAWRMAHAELQDLQAGLELR